MSCILNNTGNGSSYEQEPFVFQVFMLIIITMTFPSVPIQYTYYIPTNLYMCIMPTTILHI